MLDTLFFSINAIFPILLLVVLGYVIKTLKMGDSEFYTKLNSICFTIFLPISLFNNIYSIEDLGDVNWNVAVYCVFGIFVCFFIGYIAAKIFVKERTQKGVIIQSAFRSNYSIIGLTLAEALGGHSAVAFATIISAVSIPLYNILAVVSLELYSGNEDEKTSVHKILIKTIQNPLIIGIMLGILCLIVRMLLPLNDSGQPLFMIKNNIPFLYSALQNVGKIASPLMLVVLGAQFDFGAAAQLVKQIILGTSLRLVVSPLLGIGIAVLLKDFLNLTTLEMPALIAMFSTPVAVSSVVMTEQSGGDGQLAAQLVVWTSILSIFTMLVITFTLKTFCLV